MPLLKSDIFDQPEPSYVHLSYIKQHMPLKLIEYYESIVGITQYKD